MTERNRGPGKPFVKGDPRCGRKPVPDDIKLIKTMTYGEFKVLVFKVLSATPEELEHKFNGTVMEKAVARIMKSVIKYGDASKFDFILNRLWGKVPDKIDLTESDKLRTLSDIEIAARVEQSLNEFKAKRLNAAQTTKETEDETN